jgi:hypothetical protein
MKYYKLPFKIKNQPSTKVTLTINRLNHTRNCIEIKQPTISRTHKNRVRISQHKNTRISPK